MNMVKKLIIFYKFTIVSEPYGRCVIGDFIDSKEITEAKKSYDKKQ